jgi:tetratricopeptide (TPR) repeat protein
MNNNLLHTDTLLDELIHNKLSYAETEAALIGFGEHNAKEEIELHFSAAKALQRYRVLQQVQQVHSKYLQKLPPPQSEAGSTSKLIKLASWKWIMRIAASVLLILGGWTAYQYADTSSTKLYSEIYQDYNVNTDRGLGDPVTHNMVKEFQAGNYTNVIKIYAGLPVTNNREKFLAGYAYMQTGDNSTACGLFNQILHYNMQSQTRLYSDEAEFYAGLCHLKLKQNKKALQVFRSIHNNPDHTYHDRVKNWTITRLKWLK